MADSWNDRLETLQKTLDDFIKFATDRFNVMEERQKRLEDKLDNPVPTENSGIQEKPDERMEKIKLKLAKSQVLTPSPQIVSTPPTETPKFQFHHHPIAPIVITPSSTVQLRPILVTEQCHCFCLENTVAKIHQPRCLTPMSHHTYKMKKNVDDWKFLSTIGILVLVDVKKLQPFVAKIIGIDMNLLLQRPPRKRMKHNFLILSSRTRTLSRGEE